MKTIRPFLPASDLGLTFDNIFKARCELKRKDNGWKVGYRTGGHIPGHSFSVLPLKGKEHPLVENDRRAGLQKTDRTCSWASVFHPSGSLLVPIINPPPPPHTYTHLNFHLQSKWGPSSFKSKDTY